MINITTEKVPIKMWLDEIEDGAMQQAKNLADLPFVFKWIALMPDCHQGYGMPIGGVLAADQFIVPNAVGVDIGCGMCAVRTSLKNIDSGQLKKIMSLVRARIPLGFNHHIKPQKWQGFDNAPDIPVIRMQLQSAQYQLGTLGGGNHFIEIQKGSDGFIWIMLHSGSRNFGLKIAAEYHKKALYYCDQNNYQLADNNLAYLPAATEEAKEYFEAMNFALEFARESRLKMLEAVKDFFLSVCVNVSFDDTINIHHNYAALESHYGYDVIVHRKGATSARKGQIGIIPGSQGTRSYIVTGKGNPESFMSCSHGAGRKIGRKEAQRRLDLKHEKKILDDQGIIHSIRTVKDLDEASGAYKDIDTVMRNQQDLVHIAVSLEPLAVIKG
ncbi:MAG: RtcB family protein [Spirochaetes bacterium]|nr:RtcB family protein [Spirochaetota bacterium]MBN2771297.1 RtcB family protein [Spirochaetota bacterium]